MLAIIKHLCNSIKSVRPCVELKFKHGQQLSTFVPCVFLYVFTIFDARMKTGKHGGQCFCIYYDAKIPMQLFWLELSFKSEITSPLQGVELGRL